MAEDDNVPTVQPDPVPDQNVTDSDAVDKANARDRELKSQNTDNKSWIYKNINPLLALLVVIVSFGFFGIVLNFDFSKDPAKKELIIYLVGGVQTIVTMVMSYYFGSSKGSSDKSKVIENMNKN